MNKVNEIFDCLPVKICYENFGFVSFGKLFKKQIFRFFSCLISEKTKKIPPKKISKNFDSRFSVKCSIFEKENSMTRKK